MKNDRDQDIALDEIGRWSRCKHAILRAYMVEYAKILANFPSLKPVYVDAFCGAGVAISKESGEILQGSPLLALDVQPPFHHYHFIDTDGKKTEQLQRLVGSRPNVSVYSEDCNQALLKILPNLSYEGKWRGVCFLDPYGLHLNWEVIQMAGRLKTTEIFLNFPIADMNRNVLRRDQSKTRADQAARMTAFWGDESWRDAAFSSREMLFEDFKEKSTNDQLAEAFRKRLHEVAGFEFVSKPAPMLNSTGATVYYLFFASQNGTGERIASHILREVPKKFI